MASTWQSIAGIQSDADKLTQVAATAKAVLILPVAGVIQVANGDAKDFLAWAKDRKNWVMINFGSSGTSYVNLDRLVIFQSADNGSKVTVGLDSGKSWVVDDPASLQKHWLIAHGTTLGASVPKGTKLKSQKGIGTKGQGSSTYLRQAHNARTRLFFRLSR